MLRTFTVITRLRQDMERDLELERLTGQPVADRSTVDLKKIQIPVEDISEIVEQEYETVENDEEVNLPCTLVTLTNGKSIMITEPFNELEALRLENELREEANRAEYLNALGRKA